MISPQAIEPIQKLKIEYLGSQNPALHTDETLIALSMSAAEDPNARLAMEQLPKLRGCQVHTSVMLAHVDVKMFKKLGINQTSEAIQEKGFTEYLMDENRDNRDDQWGFGGGDGNGGDRRGPGRRGGYDPGPGGGFSSSMMALIITLLVSFFLMNMGRSAINDTSRVEVPYTEFYEMVDEGIVDSVEVGETQISIRVRPDAPGYSSALTDYTQKMDDPLLTYLVSRGVTAYQQKPSNTGAHI